VQPQLEAAALCPFAEANTDSFFVRRVEPHAGHAAPRQREDRTRISLSFPHFAQWNS
jgi:hypothetical protein